MRRTVIVSLVAVLALSALAILTMRRGASDGPRVRPSVPDPTATSTVNDTRRRPDELPPEIPSRSRAEVLAQIDQVGRTPPGWFDETPLEYPETLDLSWPRKPPGPWNNQKNVGQYIWDVINPNPSKWRSGVRLLHHLLTLHPEDEERRRRVMTALGRMYFNLLRDHERAAFWWQQAGVAQGSATEPVAGIFLAECYWKLGNREMALELLERLPRRFESIKIWADLGEVDRALRVVEASTGGSAADLAYLYGGDACRVSGRLPEAIDYYQKLIDMPAAGQRKDRIKRNQERAEANLEAIRLFELSDVSKVPDGTYQDSSLGYEGPVTVEVIARGGRLMSVRVVEHREKQFYSALTDTPRKLIAKQGVTGIDATSGATITSEAIINATAKALAGAAP